MEVVYPFGARSAPDERNSTEKEGNSGCVTPSSAIEMLTKEKTRSGTLLELSMIRDTLVDQFTEPSLNQRAINPYTMIFESNCTLLLLTN